MKSSVVENSLVEGTVIKQPEPAQAQASSSAQPEPEPTTDPNQAETIAQLLAGARRDERNARLTQPLGNNALVKYRQVLALDAENTDARLGISRIADHFVANAEQFPSKEKHGTGLLGVIRCERRKPRQPIFVQH